MIDADWQAVRNVLLIRLDNLGDVLLMTPAFHALKTELPRASFTLLTSPVGAQIGRLDPDIDDVIALSGELGIHLTPIEARIFASRLQDQIAAMEEFIELRLEEHRPPLRHLERDPGYPG